MRKILISAAILILLFSARPIGLTAQQPYAPASVTAQDYERAQGFLGSAMNSLVYGTGIRANWLENGRFWYRNSIPGGTEFILVDPGRRSRERAFDHERLASALSQAAGSSYSALDLPFSTFQLGADGRAISFDVGAQSYRCEIRDYQCISEPRQAGQEGVPPRGPMGRSMAPEVVSPDGAKAAFIRDNNLWLRDTESGEEHQLTDDGIEDFGYATNNAGWTKSDRPVLLWSPDSEKIATFRARRPGRGNDVPGIDEGWTPGAGGMEVPPARRLGDLPNPSGRYRRGESRHAPRRSPRHAPRPAPVHHL